MDPQQRAALKSLRLSFAPSADDLWNAHGAFHVPGVHDRALEQVMDAFADADRTPESSPLGVVVRGQAGSGKTHLLGQVRERVQAGGGFFFLLQLLDATSFWESARSSILESLGRPAVERETQLKQLLWQLASVAHVSRADRRAIAGDDELTPETLTVFVNALHRVQPQTVRPTHHTLRALVLLGATDLGVQDVGQAYLNSAEDVDDTGRRTWAIGVSTLTPQECVRDISRLVALAGPAVMAIDQIDTLLAQSATSTAGCDDGGTDNRDLEHVAHGLMSVRETMRRTAEVVACLPSVWESIRSRATATVADRFRETATLEGLPSADVGRAILERRFTASYRAVGFSPPYPSWPILPAAFDDAPDYTPRRLLQRADAHVRACLDRDVVEELEYLGATTGTAAAPSDDGPRETTDLDRRFADYRRRAVGAAALDPEGEDTTVPGLLSAVLDAWITERADTEQAFSLDPPPGKQVRLHGRLRQRLDAETDDERHWAFRAIASTNAIAVQNRIKNACVAAGFGSNLDKRQLFLLRNDRWPGGAKTAQTIAEFEQAGGRTLALSDDDLRTASALRDLIDDDHPDLVGWLVSRKPAHGLAFLREALGEGAGPLPPEMPEPEPVPEPEPEPRPEPWAKRLKTPRREDHPTAIPLGQDDESGEPLSVEMLALRKHTAIFAGSGSGKTVLIRRIVEECARRGVSSIVLDPNNDLSRLGSAWPEPPNGWQPADTPRAADYLDNTEVVVWTPGRAGGRPLSFQPLPDFASVVDDHDEYEVAVESAFAALEPRALISGNTPKANSRRAVLRQSLQWYGRRQSTSLPGFLDVLAELPDGVSVMSNARELAAELGQNLRASMVNDRMFGGDGTPADPGMLLTPSECYRARVSVISMVGLQNDDQREGFVNQLQMGLFAWIKRNPAGDRPLGGLLVMDEAQNFAPSGRSTACLQSTLALSSQARKYGLGLIFATQAPRGLNPNIPGNAATQFFGLLNAPVQITVAKEMARVKGGLVPDIGRLRAGNFYAALEGRAFQKITAPWCLSRHPHSPLTTEEVLELAREPLGPKP
jgi:Helicase HerA, central domain